MPKRLHGVHWVMKAPEKVKFKGHFSMPSDSFERVGEELHKHLRQIYEQMDSAKGTSFSLKVDFMRYSQELSTEH